MIAATDVDVLARSGTPHPQARIGASIGVALTSGYLPAADVLRVADTAMYEAKASGGANYVVRNLDDH